MKILAGSSNQALAKKVASELDLELIEVELTKFANGEKRVLVTQNLKGEAVAVIQSFSHPTDQHIIEFLLLTDSLKRLGVQHVTAVIPWMGYSLQDKVFRQGEPIAAQVIANLVSSSFVHRVILMDLHSSQIVQFFEQPSIELTATGIFVEYAKENFDLTSAIVVSPDTGALGRSTQFAKKLQLPLAKIIKQRDRNTRQIIDVRLEGQVSRKNVLMIDDSILSGGTIIKTTQLLKKENASSINYLATHGLFVKGSINNLTNSQVNSIIITDSIAHDNLPDKIKEVSVASVIAKEIINYEVLTTTH